MLVIMETMKNILKYLNNVQTMERGGQWKGSYLFIEKKSTLSLGSVQVLHNFFGDKNNQNRD